jgi:hypothetical protein
MIIFTKGILSLICLWFLLFSLSWSRLSRWHDFCHEAFLIHSSVCTPKWEHIRAIFLRCAKVSQVEQFLWCWNLIFFAPGLALLSLPLFVGCGKSPQMQECALHLMLRLPFMRMHTVKRTWAVPLKSLRNVIPSTHIYRCSLPELPYPVTKKLVIPSLGLLWSKWLYLNSINCVLILGIQIP